MSVEVTNESGADLDVTWVQDIVGFALERLRVHPSADVAVIFVDEPAMEQLHMQWMMEPGPTDVLSFPMDELRPAAPGEPPSTGILGDIVLCPTVAERQALEAGHSTTDEMMMLTVHGLLHLLGFDHAEADQEKEMFGLQRQILDDFAGTQKARKR
jgi:probable rRNA maturation factor